MAIIKKIANSANTRLSGVSRASEDTKAEICGRLFISFREEDGSTVVTVITK